MCSLNARLSGLAQTCIHPPDVSELLPKSFFDSAYAITDTIFANTPNFVTNAARKIEQVAGHLESNTSFGRSIASVPSGDDNVHALTILARVLADSRLSLPDDLYELNIVQNTIAKNADLLRGYASQWTINIQKPGEIDRKVEEITWMNVVMYGVAGWTWAQKVKQGKEGDFNADFFL